MRFWSQTLKLGLGGRDRSMKLEAVIDFVADRTHNLKLWYERKLGNGKVIDEVYIKNRIPHSALPRQQTLFEALNGEKPSIKHLQPFGGGCCVRIPEEARPSGRNLQPRAIEEKFLGYERSDKIYRIWKPKGGNLHEPPRRISQGGKGSPPTQMYLWTKAASPRTA